MRTIKKQAVRKPAISRIRSTERKRLTLQGKSKSLTSKIDKAKVTLSNLDKSTFRLKITRQVRLQKSIAKWTSSLSKVNNQLLTVDEKLKGYTTIVW